MIESKKTMHLTINYQLKAADILISKLRQQIGANEAYVIELEEELKKLQDELTQLKNQNKAILDRYSKDTQTLLTNDELYWKYKTEITDLKTQRDMYRNQRDSAIKELIKYRNV